MVHPVTRGTTLERGHYLTIMAEKPSSTHCGSLSAGNHRFLETRSIAESNRPHSELTTRCKNPCRPWPPQRPATRSDTRVGRFTRAISAGPHATSAMSGGRLRIEPHVRELARLRQPRTGRSECIRLLGGDRAAAVVGRRRRHDVVGEEDLALRGQSGAVRHLGRRAGRAAVSDTSRPCRSFRRRMRRRSLRSWRCRS